MSQIDLRYATVAIQDGYSGPSGTGAVNFTIANPGSAPTVAVTGGGSTGGNLAAGTYLISYTYLGVFGETQNSPDSTGFTVTAGNIPQVTLPALPTGVTGINVYLSTAGGATGTETKYNSAAITTTTYNLSAAQVAGAAKPSSNTAGGYASGTTTMTVNGWTGAVNTNDLFTIVGDPASGALTQHKITAHTETGGNTTSITFTPALGVNINSGTAITILPHSLLIKVGEGTLTYDEKRKIEYITDRGVLTTVRQGADEPMDMKFDIVWDFLRAVSGSGTPTPEDALKQRGEASNWITSSSDPCEPYAVNIVVTYTPPCGGILKETITLPNFRWESINHEFKQGMLQASGKCNATLASVVRG